MTSRWRYPDLIEMMDLAASYKLRADIIGKSDVTRDDPRVYYALSFSYIATSDL